MAEQPPFIVGKNFSKCNLSMPGGMIGRYCVQLGKVGETALTMLNGEMVVASRHDGCTINVEGNKCHPGNQDQSYVSAGVQTKEF